MGVHNDRKGLAILGRPSSHFRLLLITGPNTLRDDVEGFSTPSCRNPQVQPAADASHSSAASSQPSLVKPASAASHTSVSSPQPAKVKPAVAASYSSSASSQPLKVKPAPEASHSLSASSQPLKVKQAVVESYSSSASPQPFQVKPAAKASHSLSASRQSLKVKQAVVASHSSLASPQPHKDKTAVVACHSSSASPQPLKAKPATEASHSLSASPQPSPVKPVLPASSTSDEETSTKKTVPGVIRLCERMKVSFMSPSSGLKKLRGGDASYCTALATSIMAAESKEAGEKTATDVSAARQFAGQTSGESATTLNFHKKVAAANRRWMASLSRSQYIGAQTERHLDFTVNMNEPGSRGGSSGVYAVQVRHTQTIGRSCR
jgi:hypothetical protein